MSCHPINNARGVTKKEAYNISISPGIQVVYPTPAAATIPLYTYLAPRFNFETISFISLLFA